ncbi:MAG TPA: DNRLRE domain-containing protein [Thermoanaerobaculia bacterium]
MRRLAVTAIMLIAVTAAAQRHRAVRSAGPQPVTPQPQQVVLTASKDNTLFESSNGGQSDGAGVHLFTGRTNTGSRRRALIAFDLSQIPAGAKITSVTLTLHVSLSVAGTETLALHGVSADWGEGTSNAGAFRDGNGTSSKTNDATWIHRFFSSLRWTSAGGDFDSSTDATAAAGGSETDVVFNATTAMIARVQAWVDQPSTNFGWIVIGNESASRSTKQLDSRESASTSTRPTLAIDYTH